MQSGERKVLSNDKIIAKQFFRLLPVQVLLIVIPNLNGFISSLFATNKIGADAMSAIATYSPILQLLMSVGTMMLGGSQILCGKYMGRNEIGYFLCPDCFPCGFCSAGTLRQYGSSEVHEP